MLGVSLFDNRITRPGRKRRPPLWLVGFLIVLAWPVVALAQGGDASPQYRTVLGLNPRLVVWIVAELHSMFASFVLGVPIFAVIIETVGFHRNKEREFKEYADGMAKRTDLTAEEEREMESRLRDFATVQNRAQRYDTLAYQFTGLLTAAFATTAALGGLLAFTLFSAYPAFMDHLTGVFHSTFYIYALFFFGETFTLYIYYYSWKRMSHGRAKRNHILIGVLLNIFSLILLCIANSWASYMMSPPGLIEGAAGPLETHWSGGTYIGPFREAFFNALWMPLNIHRIPANTAFGGAICGAYAAIRFMAAKTKEERAQYDWMGYVGNFVAVAALIPLPFAGYWLGREVYSFNPTMGQDMMGGTFSWTFILQAVFVGTLFITSNFYLWSGIGRIPGGERYERFVPWMIGIIFICFAIWLTPHNLPMGGLEKKFGLMPAKNAVIQLIILTTYAAFLMYRRANKVGPVSVPGAGARGRLAVVIGAVVSIIFLLMYATSYDLSDGNPELARFMVEKLPIGFLSLDIGGRFSFAATLRWTLYAQCAWVIITAVMVFLGRGRSAQGILVGATTFHASFWLFQHGFTIMEKANPLVRQIAVCQVLMILSCLIVATIYDILLYRGAKSLGPIRWGKMHNRSQYALLLLCVTFVMNMGLMGFIRSGLRKGWHVVAVMKDTSEWAGTPSNFYMAIVVSSISITFLLVAAFVFYMAGLLESRTMRVQMPAVGPFGNEDDGDV